MYGENGAKLRAELTVLLRQHRIQHRLGGRGIYTLPESTTTVERSHLGQQIRRYRHALLVWCLQAVRAADPAITLGRTSGRRRGPVEEFEHRLETTINGSTAGLPPLDELTIRQAFPLVETWRQAARAAALSEHDFDAGLGYGRLSNPQCNTVLNDAANVTRAIIALDRRYTNIPGWRPLKDQGRLRLAAEACALSTGANEPDYTVDLRGWRPPPATIDGPGPPGIAGVLQAEHNLVVHLDTFPDARSIRLVLESQRIVSHTAAALVEPSDPERALRWRARESTYHRLTCATRDLAGQLGNGGPAAGQASVAATRVQRLTAAAFADPTLLTGLDELFGRVDGQIRRIIEYGAKERLYLLRAPFPRLDDDATGLVKPMRERYLPIATPVGLDLIAIVRTDLRAEPRRTQPPAAAAQSRADLKTAITHRTGSRASNGPIGL